MQISRVQYDSLCWDDRSNGSLNGEWVEITNTTRNVVNLEGWTLSDRDRHIPTGIGRDSRGDLYQDRRAYV
ncbi:hypothetical protein [Streptomyces sp. NPDC004008]